MPVSPSPSGHKTSARIETNTIGNHRVRCGAEWYWMVAQWNNASNSDHFYVKTHQKQHITLLIYGSHKTKRKKTRERERQRERQKNPTHLQRFTSLCGTLASDWGGNRVSARLAYLRAKELIARFVKIHLLTRCIVASVSLPMFAILPSKSYSRFAAICVWAQCDEHKDAIVVRKIHGPYSNTSRAQIASPSKKSVKSKWKKLLKYFLRHFLCIIST